MKLTAARKLNPTNPMEPQAGDMVIHKDKRIKGKYRLYKIIHPENAYGITHPHGLLVRKGMYTGADMKDLELAE